MSSHAPSPPPPLRAPALLTLLAFALASPASAQWVTESYHLEAGWNAIWLSHDASHDTIDDLFPAAVEEVWRWNPASSRTQFTQSPAAPVQPDTQWLVWRRDLPTESTMHTLGPNAAYLVKVADGTPDLNVAVTGKPAPPSYTWKSSGLNFFGFPVQSPDDPNPEQGNRNFETFLSYSPALSAGPDLFKYDGGPIEANPVQILSPIFEPVTRGRAYWLRSSQFTDYYGPLRVIVATSGLAFGDTGNAVALRLANATAAPLDATLAPVASAPAPAGQPPVAGAVPLRLRGALDPATGQFSYSGFEAAATVTLAPGEERQFVFAVDRAAMGGSAGDSFQGVLRITDSLDVARIDLPVSAQTTSRSGLWVGTAVITQVDQVTAAPDPQPDGTAEVDVTTDAGAAAPRPYPMRLILHRDSAGNVKLLQRVYLGEASGGTILTRTESLLDPAKLATARRLSSATLPLGESFAGTGDIGLAPASLSLSVVLGPGRSTNPFVHTFHPDHKAAGAPTVTRDIELAFAAAAPAGVSELGWGSTVLGGAYAETFTGLRAQPITVAGSFLLYRLSDIDTLTE